MAPPAVGIARARGPWVAGIRGRTNATIIVESRNLAGADPPGWRRTTDVVARMATGL
jgi:hypothetical protein